MDRAALFAYVATSNDLYWILDDAAQQQLLALPPSAFDDDSGTWGLVLLRRFTSCAAMESAEESMPIRPD